MNLPAEKMQLNVKTAAVILVVVIGWTATSVGAYYKVATQLEYSEKEIEAIRELAKSNTAAIRALEISHRGISEELKRNSEDIKEILRLQRERYGVASNKASSQ